MDSFAYMRYKTPANIPSGEHLVLRNIPSSYNDYFEPFVGGATWFFTYATHFFGEVLPKTKSFYLSDSAERLIKCHQLVQKQGSKVFDIIERLMYKYDIADPFSAYNSLSEEEK